MRVIWTITLVIPKTPTLKILLHKNLYPECFSLRFSSYSHEVVSSITGKLQRKTRKLYLSTALRYICKTSAHVILLTKVHCKMIYVVSNSWLRFQNVFVGNIIDSIFSVSRIFIFIWICSNFIAEIFILLIPWCPVVTSNITMACRKQAICSVTLWMENSSQFLWGGRYFWYTSTVHYYWH